MKNVLATILSIILYIPVNIYQFIFERDFCPCPFGAVRDAWLDVLQPEQEEVEQIFDKYQYRGIA